MSIIRDLLYTGLPREVDPLQVCREAGIDPATLLQGEAGIDMLLTNQVWEIATRLSGDALLGLHAGEKVSPMLVGKVGLCMQCCSTASEMIDILCEWGHLYCNLKTYSRETKGPELLMYADSNAVWENLDPMGVTQSLDFGLSTLIKLLYTLTGRRIFPLRLELKHSPSKLPEYERIFRCPIIPQAARNCLVFRKSDLEAPVLSQDQSLFAFFTEMLRKESEAAQETIGFTEKIKRLLLTEFKGIIPPVEVVAAQLNTTVRTFQRKLALENSSYRELCALVRKELALQLIENKGSKVGEVADLLGYSDPTTFRRAFKSWVNTTPKEVKRKARQQKSS
ncbi:AraC family transcriptional regulator, partial [Cesiribacter andamanensis]|uniref:AraC family transcriptional regulator n=1 Tax=Cesiribacter andamanensis TaxID=649507 RepID=UPI001376A1BC